jgi:hypothetical protein
MELRFHKIIPSPQHSQRPAHSICNSCMVSEMSHPSGSTDRSLTEPINLDGNSNE